MNARTVILAFLAERAPAAYSEEAIKQRVTASGLLDTPPASVNSELAYLASDRMKGLVSVDVNPTSMESVWYATTEGVKRWTMDGRLHVG
jgi:hypothetical protein